MIVSPERAPPQPGKNELSRNLIIAAQPEFEVATYWRARYGIQEKLPKFKRMRAADSLKARGLSHLGLVRENAPGGSNSDLVSHPVLGVILDRERAAAARCKERAKGRVAVIEVGFFDDPSYRLKLLPAASAQIVATGGVPFLGVGVRKFALHDCSFRNGRQVQNFSALSTKAHFVQGWAITNAKQNTCIGKSTA
jgi:hypothetical protein